MSPFAVWVNLIAECRGHKKEAIYPVPAKNLQTIEADLDVLFSPSLRIASGASVLSLVWLNGQMPTEPGPLSKFQSVQSQRGPSLAGPNSMVELASCACPPVDSDSEVEV